jgi:hypothetical protein
VYVCDSHRLQDSAVELTGYILSMCAKDSLTEVTLCIQEINSLRYLGSDIQWAIASFDALTLNSFRYFHSSNQCHFSSLLLIPKFFSSPFHFYNSYYFLLQSKYI